MKPIIDLPVVLRIAGRLVLGGVFLAAGATKLIDPAAFADSIASFQLMPAALIAPAALTLPPFEIALGVMLLAGIRLRSALFATGLLLIVFLLAVIQAWQRGLPVDCGCFGPWDPFHGHPWLIILRDAILLAAASWLYRSAAVTEPN